MLKRISDSLRHFFHLVSNVRPIVWICVYMLCIPMFALIYYMMPDTQFRIPDGSVRDFGSCIYYSIVTITTLGFGDYTPAHAVAQCVTAMEVTCGLLLMGFFLNSVGSMKSEIDVQSELERQRRMHEAAEQEKLKKTIPIIIHKLNRFLAYCYAVTTPVHKRGPEHREFDPDFTFQDMQDLYRPTELPFDRSVNPAVTGLLKSADDTSLFLDALQSRIDMTVWPGLLEDCFSFVAATQLFDATDAIADSARDITGNRPDDSMELARLSTAAQIRNWKGEVEASVGNPLNPVIELFHYIKENGRLAIEIEASLTKAVSAMENTKQS